MTKSWYVAKYWNNSQGLVIEEETGRNVAVTFDAKDAYPIAALPELLEACEAAYQELQELSTMHIRTDAGDYVDVDDAILGKVSAAIREAKGE